MIGSDTAVTFPSVQLIFDDGEPMETWWHRAQMNLLIDVIERATRERGRHDSYTGGNQFIYYSRVQAQAVATRPPAETRHFVGPDVFWVGGVPVGRERPGWVVWEEDGRYPDLIIELLSPSTARIDRTIKKDIYERTFRTPDYFLYDRESDLVEGFHLVEGTYRVVEPDERGRWRVASLDLWLGRWQGFHSGTETTWIRLYDDGGRLIPTTAEAEQAECERADAACRRADAAEEELRRQRGSSATWGPDRA